MSRADDRNAKTELLPVVGNHTIVAASLYSHVSHNAGPIELIEQGDVQEFLDKLDFDYSPLEVEQAFTGIVYLQPMPYARWISRGDGVFLNQDWEFHTSQIPKHLRAEKPELKVNTARVKSITMDIDFDMTPWELLAHHARISNPANEYNHQTAPKLLNTMKEKGEWSSFEQIDVNVEIKTTRDIARQILRHRSFSFQEFSQRYANPVDLLGFALRDVRMQDLKNRQSSIVTDDPEINQWWEDAQNDVIETTSKLYREGIEKGVAKEQIRALLPEGLTVSRLYMKGSIRSWIHYINLRTHKSTQYEHRLVANSIRDEIIRYIPLFEFLLWKHEE